METATVFSRSGTRTGWPEPLRLLRPDGTIDPGSPVRLEVTGELCRQLYRDMLVFPSYREHAVAPRTGARHRRGCPQPADASIATGRLLIRGCPV